MSVENDNVDNVENNNNDNQVIDEQKNKEVIENNQEQQNNETVDDSLTISEILKDCKSFDDLFKHEEVSKRIEESKKAELDEVHANLLKREQKINELMDELKPLKKNFKSDEHMKMFNNLDVEGFTKRIEDDISASYKEIISTNENLYNTDKQALTTQNNELVSANEKLKESLKDIKLQKFFSDKDIDKNAIEDAIKFAKEDFDIDENLDFKSKVSDQTVESWIDTQRTKRSYWFKQFEKSGVSSNNRALNSNVSKDLADMSLSDYMKARDRQENKKK